MINLQIEFSPEIQIANALPKITPESAQKESGLNTGNLSDISTSLLSKDGVSIGTAAGNIKFELFDNNDRIEESYVRGVIIDILSYGSVGAYKNSILKTDRIVEIRKELRDLKEGNNVRRESAYNLEWADNETDVDLNIKRQQRLQALYNSRINKLKDMINIAKANNQSKRFRYLTDELNKISSADFRKSIEDVSELKQLTEFAKRDLEEIATMLSRKDYEFSDMVYARKVLSNWESVFELYFTKEEEETGKDMVALFAPIVNEARVLSEKLNRRLTSLYERGIKGEFNKSVDLVQFFEELKDVDIYRKEGLDISRIDNVLFNYSTNSLTH